MGIDIILISGAIVLLLAGLLGSFVPVLPGPPLSLAGLLMIHFSSFARIPENILYTFTILTVVITLVDYLLPIWGTRLGKGSKHGVFGATIGLVIGIFFFPPVGVLVGPVAGAWIAERVNGKPGKEALRSALGSFFGLLLGAVLKFALSMAMIWWALSGMIMN